MSRNKRRFILAIYDKKVKLIRKPYKGGKYGKANKSVKTEEIFKPTKP